MLLPWPTLFPVRRWQIDEPTRLGWRWRRQMEPIAMLVAHGVTKVSVSFWHFPDLRLTKHAVKGNSDLGDKLATEIREWQLTPTPGQGARKRQAICDHLDWREIPSEFSPAAAAVTAGIRSTRAELVAIVPCYNVDGACGDIVREAADFAGRVIAVNDGSTDGTLEMLEAAQADSGGRVEVIGWDRNRGKGAALLAAFRHAAHCWPEHSVVTLDGDGQHQARDIGKLALMLTEEDCDLVIGERLAREKMPLRSRLGNGLTAVLLKRAYPAAPTDTQSGFRAFSPRFVREILETVAGGRYETELQILLLALRQGRRIGSVTIPTVYLEDNRLSHFRPLVDSWRIYRALFTRSYR